MSCTDHIADQAALEIKIGSIQTTTTQGRHQGHSHAKIQGHLSTQMTVSGPNKALLTLNRGNSKTRTVRVSSTAAKATVLTLRHLLSRSTARTMTTLTFTASRSMQTPGRSRTPP